MPNTVPISIIMMMLAFWIAAIAAMPSECDTQNVFTVAFSDCSTLVPSTGSMKKNIVLAIGPLVRS